MASQLGSVLPPLMTADKSTQPDHVAEAITNGVRGTQTHITSVPEWMTLTRSKPESTSAFLVQPNVFKISEF